MVRIHIVNGFYVMLTYEDARELIVILLFRKYTCIILRSRQMKKLMQTAAEDTERTDKYVDIDVDVSGICRRSLTSIWQRL